MLDALPEDKHEGDGLDGLDQDVLRGQPDYTFLGGHINEVEQ